MTTIATTPSDSCEPKLAPKSSPTFTAQGTARCTRELGLVHRIDVGIHIRATEGLIVELRSMDAGELSTLYSWVGRVVEPALVRTLLAKPQALEWRNIRRNSPHGGESYARQHTLYVHIYAPHEIRAGDVNTHEQVQRRCLEWLASDAAGSSNRA